jgi:hypothetical protein
MEWFKHKTNAHDDPVVSAAMDEFGHVGYVAWFILLELYGQSFNASKPEKKLNISWTLLARKFRIRATKVKLILNYYATFDKLILNEGEKRVTIEIVNFANILSNWSKRKATQPTEVPTEVPTAETRLEKSREDKEKGARVPKEYSEAFSRLWSEYPNGGSKWDSYQAFLKLTARLDSDKINEAVVFWVDKIQVQAKHKAQQREKNEFVAEWPLLATWLRKKRWEDEVKISDVYTVSLEDKMAKAKALQEHITGVASG